MLRVILAILAFLCVVAFPNPAGAVVDRAGSLDGTESMLMTLPAVAVITLHYVHRRSNTV